MSEPLWPEANPDYKPGDPVTPEMVLRTLRAMHEAGEMANIIAFVISPPDGHGGHRIHRQMSETLLPLAIGVIEAQKFRLLQEWSVDPILRALHEGNHSLVESIEAHYDQHLKEHHTDVEDA